MGQVFDENFLTTIATLGAFAIRQYPEAVVVMVFTVLVIFAGCCMHSRKSIKSLLDCRPDYVNPKVGNDIREVVPRKLKLVISYRSNPGKGCLDAIIIEGYRH